MTGIPADLRTRLRHGAVFDLDGTLVDTAPTLDWALNISLCDVGLATLPPDTVRRCIGQGLDRFVDLALEQIDLSIDSELAGQLRLLFADRVRREPCRGAVVADGAVTLLERLRMIGIPIGVCTNKPAAAADAVLAGMGLRPLVDILVGGDALPQRKPDPRPLLHCLHQLGTQPSAAVFVGDSAIDAATGVAAGCAVVLVRGGYESLPLDDLGASAVIDKLDDLLGVIA